MAPRCGLLALLVGTSIAKTPPSVLHKRQCLPAVEYTPEISYVGCYEDAEASKTLFGPKYRTGVNSPEACAEVCGRRGFAYAGVENGEECFCSNKITGELAASEDECLYDCPGDKQAKCGGEWRVNIWSVENALGDDDAEQMIFPDCAREPLCSNDICNPSLSSKERAAALISLWTIEEKTNNLVEWAAGVPRIGIRPYNWWAEGLHGLATSPGVHFDPPGTGRWDKATSFPQPIVVGAAFDDELVTAIADVISTETRAYNGDGRVGLDLYTPNINSFKDPRWGRGQETPGEDPFHLQSYTAALLTGLERRVDGRKKVIATCKHYAGNDFDEYGNVTRHNFDANISPQELNEFYLPPFRTCADRGVGAFMCSYNSVNGAPSCANSYLMQGLLREHWGWESDEHYVSTDCGAIRDIWQHHEYVATEGEAAAVGIKAGVDVECEFGYAGALVEAYSDNLITKGEMDKALTRLWATLVSAGFFDDNPLRQIGWADVDTEASRKLAYDAAVSGLVLLKNDASHLPLSRKQSVAFVGPWFNVSEEMQGNYFGPSPYLVSPLQAAQDLGLDFTWAKGSNISETHSSFDEALHKASEADHVVFMGGIDNSIESESQDRDNITWPAAQLDLLRELMTLEKPLTVVQFGGGQLDDSEILDNEAASALLWAGYPGQSGGAAVLDVLYGIAAPAGRLPVTQYPAAYVDAVPPTDMTLRPFQNGTNPGRTHIWYSGDAVVPFGSGLHYTKFKVQVPSAINVEEPFSGSLEEDSTFDIASVDAALQTTWWLKLLSFPVVSLPIRVKNVGNATSDYVALVFLRTSAGPEPRPNKTLAGYARVRNIKPGQTRAVSVALQLERFLRVAEDGSQVLYPGDSELFVDIDEKASVRFKWEGDPLTVEKFPVDRPDMRRSVSTGAAPRPVP